jgi:hypothetical protein
MWDRNTLPHSSSRPACAVCHKSSKRPDFRKSIHGDVRIASDGARRIASSRGSRLTIAAAYRTRPVRGKGRARLGQTSLTSAIFVQPVERMRATSERRSSCRSLPPVTCRTAPRSNSWASREHLDTLRAADPTVKLAAAQHALAREYGFESWPRLVYTAIAGRPHSGFERAAHAAAPLSTRTDSIRSGPGMPARVGR